jgi:hypothetical protein
MACAVAVTVMVFMFVPDGMLTVAVPDGTPSTLATNPRVDWIATAPDDAPVFARLRE